MSRLIRITTLIMAGALMLAGHAAWARDNQDQPQQRRLFGILPPQSQQRQQAAPQYEQRQDAPRPYQDYGQDPRRYQGYGYPQADPRAQPRYAQPRYADPRYGGYGQAETPQDPRNDGRYQNDPYARGYDNDSRGYQDPRYAAPRASVDDNRSRSLLPGLLAPRQRDSRQDSYGGMSSDQAAREVQSRHGGRVLSVQPDGSGYRVKTLKDGEVRIYQVYP